MKPFVELSFMPSILASGDQTVFHYRANVTSPKDYAQWAVLIRKLVSHWVDRYGLGEVPQWFFEVWNEPNLTAFGSAKQGDYFELYRYTWEAIKGVDKMLKVGGPATANNAWIEDFLQRAAGRFRQHAPLSDGCVRQARRRYDDGTCRQQTQHPAQAGPRRAKEGGRTSCVLYGVVHILEPA